MRAEISRSEFLASVAQRRREIGESVLTRVQAIAPRGEENDAEYLEGIRRAVETAVDHTIRASKGGAGEDSRLLRLPDEVLAQTRLAARSRTPLETVLRRYQAGHAVLSDHVVEEAERQSVSAALLRSVLRAQSVITDVALAEISATYLAEADSLRPVSVERRRAESVRRLLTGELVDASWLDYDLERWHVGIVARGLRSPEDLIGVSRDLDSGRLVTSDGDHICVWLGWSEPPDVDQIMALLSSRTSSGVKLGVGEPAVGRTGWRLTHEQARAAVGVATVAQDSVYRYIDVSLVASALKDELLCDSLRRLYLDPLSADHTGGAVLRDTLRVFLAADRNVSSAAASLGVSRNTVTNRLRAIESRIGHLRPSRAGDLALALRLDELTMARCQT